MSLGQSPFNSVRNRETWILDGPTWKLPVWVKASKHGESEVELRLGAGLRLLDIQRATAGAFLSIIGRQVGTRWIVNREMLSTVARRTVRRPEECVIWNPSQERPEQYGTLRFGRPMADEFVKSFFNSNHCLRLQDLTEVVYLFNAFCKHAFNWLLNLQRPLDLVFCVLHPVPYRVNWKERMKSYVKNGILVHHAGHPITPEDVAKAMESENILNPELLDYDPDKETIRWGLEIHPTQLWRDHVAKLEAQRKLEKGNGYWVSVVDMIKRRSAHLAKLYAYWKDQATHPSPPLSPQWTEERGDPLPGGAMPVASPKGNGVPVQPLHRKAKTRKPRAVAKKD